MLHLNEKLLKELASTLRMTYKEISSLSNISMTTLYRIIDTPSKISVQQLIDLANGLRVPVSRFFSKDNNDLVGQREDYIKFDGYNKCFYNKDAMQRVINSDVVSSYRDIANAVGLHPNRVKESLLAEHRLPVTRLLRFCNTLNIKFSYFIVDPNSISVNAVKQKTTSTAAATEYTTIQREIKTLLHEQTIFITEVRRNIARIDKKLDMIIDAYFEEITAADEPTPIAERARQVVKEIQSQAVKQLVNNEPSSTAALARRVAKSQSYTDTLLVNDEIA